MTQRTLRQERLPLPIAPRGGAIGTLVTLSATGLPPSSTLFIAFANLQNYQLLQRVVTDENGSFSTTQVVPPWAVVHGAHYFFASFADEIPLAFSYAFHVTSGGGAARVQGAIGSRTEGCVDLRTAGDILYHLVGEIGERKPGDRVAVIGTIADAAACGGTGIVIAATEVAPLLD
ncbi:MAG: hypothetical protein EXR95_02735 [Gemmatimonadetes bacterium]|nr:hypothetical protein [Gemmatimonadota bacterium]